MIVAVGLIVASASIYLVYVLEILKFRRLDTVRLRRLRPDASAAEIERGVARDLETGEMDVVSAAQRAPGNAVFPRVAGDSLRAEPPVAERQVNQERVGAEDERGGAQAPVATDRG